MRRAALLGLALAVCLGPTSRLSSADGNQFVPFKGTFTGTWDNIFDGLFAPPANFEGGGNITHMGDTTWSLTLFLGPPDQNLMAPGIGFGAIVAANGDTVFVEYVGELDVATGGGAGTFTVTGGTGRFANATGQGTFTASIDLSFSSDQPMTSSIDGSISY
jgi:hypothetical protein